VVNLDEWSPFIDVDAGDPVDRIAAGRARGTRQTTCHLQARREETAPMTTHLSADEVTTGRLALMTFDEMVSRLLQFDDPAAVWADVRDRVADELTDAAVAAGLETEEEQ
jgi:hypothetical protein